MLTVFTNFVTFLTCRLHSPAAWKAFVVTHMTHIILTQYTSIFCNCSKEDIHLEAVKALKAPNPNADDEKFSWETKSAPVTEQAMPKFAEIVIYIQEKVRSFDQILGSLYWQNINTQNYDNACGDDTGNA